MKNRKDESRAFQEWDEDADVDESGKPRWEFTLVHATLVIRTISSSYEFTDY